MVIVPAAGIEASPMLKDLPKIIACSLPFKLAGKSYRGLSGDPNVKSDEYVHDVFQRVFNYLLEQYGERVVTLDGHDVAAAAPPPVLEASQQPTASSIAEGKQRGSEPSALITNLY